MRYLKHVTEKAGRNRTTTPEGCPMGIGVCVEYSEDEKFRVMKKCVYYKATTPGYVACSCGVEKVKKEKVERVPKAKKEKAAPAEPVKAETPKVEIPKVGLI